MALLQVNRGRWIAVTAFSLTMMLGLSHAVAGPLATTNFALNNGAGPDGGRWRGSVSIVAAASGDAVTAEVDWAVFANGNFQSYLNGQGIAQVDPSAANEAIYVYQIVAVTAAVPGIDVLTVGVDPPDLRGGVSAPAFVPTGAATEKSPASGGDTGTSMAWFFNGTEPHVGNTSSLLVFTSRNAPELDFLAVTSGLAGPSPSPLVGSPSNLLTNIPEPSALFLALVSGVCLAGRGRRNAPKNR